MKLKPNQPNKDIKQGVLARLEHENVAPMPKAWFRCLDCLMWMLWGVTVVLGALAVAVILCLSIINSTAFVEATHDSHWQFWLEAIPFIWIIFFVLMTAVAYRNFRHTKRGYRYGLGKVLGGSIVLSVLLGAVFHEVGLGYLIDQRLGESMPLYDSQEQKELTLWQSPAEGRLVGVADSTDDALMLTDFVDAAGTVWQLDTMELAEADVKTLTSGKQVKILGMQASSSNRFYACGVFPWMYDEAMDWSELGAERTAFMERMYDHKDAADRLEAIDEAVYAGRDMGMCAKMPAIPRISESMQ